MERNEEVVSLRQLAQPAVPTTGSALRFVPQAVEWPRPFGGRSQQPSGHTEFGDERIGHRPILAEAKSDDDLKTARISDHSMQRIAARMRQHWKRSALLRKSRETEPWDNSSRIDAGVDPGKALSAQQQP